MKYKKEFSKTITLLNTDNIEIIEDIFYQSTQILTSARESFMAQKAYRKKI